MALGLLQFAHLKNPFLAIHQYLLPTKTPRQMRSHRDSLVTRGVASTSKNESLCILLKQVREIRSNLSNCKGVTTTVNAFKVSDRLDELEEPQWQVGKQALFNRPEQMRHLPRVFKVREPWHLTRKHDRSTFNFSFRIFYIVIALCYTNPCTSLNMTCIHFMFIVKFLYHI